MSLPGNGIFIVRGEVSTLLTAVNRSKWQPKTEGEAATLQSLHDLKRLLMATNDLRSITTRVYLKPFLAVVRSETTSGQLTSLALNAVYKVLTYGLLADGEEVEEISELMDEIADAATHARFVSSDLDAVVLLRIVQVLKLLMLGQEGKLLSNGSVCEIMLCCFRISFEPKLNELLRRTAESALKDMVLSLFVQLPSFSEEEGTTKPLKIGGKMINSVTKSQSSSSLKVEVTEATPEPPQNQEKGESEPLLLTTPLPLANRLIDVHGSSTPKTAFTQIKSPRRLQTDREVGLLEPEEVEKATIQPYGMPCARELFRFLISLCDPTHKQNSETMIHIGLTLLGVAFETASPHITQFSSLLTLVQNELCKNLIALLETDRLSILAANLQLCFLVFESMRSYLKFQLEKFLVKLSEIIANDIGTRNQQEMREMALETLIQFWKIPSFLSEVYINYDCDYYCSNVLKDSIQQLFKYTQTTLQVDNNIYNLHIEALSTIVEAISKYHSRAAQHGIEVTPPASTASTTQVSISTPTGPSIALNLATHEPKFQIGGKTLLVGIKKENLIEIERKKTILAQGIELFNKNPDRAIQFLQEHKILRTIGEGEIDPNEIVLFLREHPLLDKKIIGEYISKRKNTKILKAYVNSFNFLNTGIDKALRMYLEAFRLPGEAPLISTIIEEFSEHWHTQNGEPFSNVDAAFRLAYAIIMLNMDQHNQNAKRLNVPMTDEDFIKNLRGLNGNGDFDRDLLLGIYESIKTEEMVLPSEQAGPVRDNYLWQVLLRRGSGPEGVFYHTFEAVYAEMIFKVVAKPFVGVLSASLERGEHFERVRAGFGQTAYLCSLYAMNEELDSLVLTLCKLTLLLGGPEGTKITSYSAFAATPRSQVATQILFEVIHLYGTQGIREGWKYIIDILVRLFKLKLLPDSFVVIEDFCEPDGKYSLVKENAMAKNEAGLFSSFYTYMAGDQRDGEDSQLILAKQSIEKCQLDAIFTKSKLLSSNALEDVIEYLMSVIKCPRKHLSEKGQQIPEDILTFSIELLVKILAASGEQLGPVWSKTSSELFEVLTCSCDCGADFVLHRLNSALLRASINIMQNEELCPEVLQTLSLYTKSPTPALIHKISVHVATGVNELLKKSAQNIHTDKEWEVIFSLLEVYGAGVTPAPSSPEQPTEPLITFPCKVIKHSPAAFKKSVDSMAFIIRNVAHITPYNFERCVASIRMFLEAALQGQKIQEKRGNVENGSGTESADDQDERHNSQVLQLLDLMHTLHARTAQIYRWWAEEGGSMPHCSTLWRQGWCPLLQGMARAGFDKRKEIRTIAITCLQRALLVHDLETLTGLEWSSCLQDVLFPLLKHLISLKVTVHELNSIEESRSRTTSMMCKVFLHHLQPLLLLPNINQLWMDILSYIECLTRIGSDELVEAVKESLKNMLLVMRSVKMFQSNPSAGAPDAIHSEQNTEFWDLTWKRLEGFLPTLKDELLEQDLFMTHGRGVRDIQIPSPTDILHQKLENKQPEVCPPPAPASAPAPPAPAPASAPSVPTEERRESNVSLQTSPYVSILTPSPPHQSPTMSQSPPKFTPTAIIKNLQEAEKSYNDEEAFVSIEKVAESALNGTKSTFDYCETRETIVCLDEAVVVVDEKPGVNVFMPSAYFSNLNGSEMMNDFVPSTSPPGGGLQKPV